MFSRQSGPRKAGHRDERETQCSDESPALGIADRSQLQDFVRKVVGVIGARDRLDEIFGRERTGVSDEVDVTSGVTTRASLSKLGVMGREEDEHVGDKRRDKDDEQ